LRHLEVIVDGPPMGAMGVGVKRRPRSALLHR